MERLEELVIPVCECVVDADTTDTDTSLEEDLTEALDLLEQALLIMESIKVQQGVVTRLPKGMKDLLEDVSEFLDQFVDFDAAKRDAQG